MDKSFIEESLPIKDISIQSTKEKNLRKGTISLLHLWWARRPLSSSRATNFASLIRSSENIEDWNNKRNFIIDLCKIKNTYNLTIIRKAQNYIKNLFPKVPPKILDPFSGGGAIPLEAYKIGCEVFAGDYNPVAILIEKATLEFPFISPDNLIHDIQKWGKWIYEKSKNEMKKFLPNEERINIGYFGENLENFTPIGYIWANTIKCLNPTCNAELPLIRQYWLANKNKKKVSFFPYIHNNQINFKIVGDGYEEFPEGFKPEKGTISRGIATCLVCGSVQAGKDVRKQFKEDKHKQKLIVIILFNERKKEKFYRISEENDIKIYNNSSNYLIDKIDDLKKDLGIDPIPNEIFPSDVRMITEPLGSAQNYNFKTWGDIYNDRQKLSHLIFIENIKLVYKELIKDYKDTYAKIITTYLGLMHSRHSSYNAKLCWWEPSGERPFNVFGRPALQMVYDYCEQNPFENLTGSWKKQLKITIDVLSNLISFKKENLSTVHINQMSATDLNYEDNYFDAVFTDPPYYDNIAYSYLSDFFYVWLKRSLGSLYPELFSTPTTPKTKEIVAYKPNSITKEQGKKNFENLLYQSFKEIHRVLKPNGIGIIVYAHKTTEGWETIINAIIKSGLTVTGSWPISTEMATRLIAEKSAALASSIYIIIRKTEKAGMQFYPEIKKKMKIYFEKKLNRLWNEGIIGADFFISAIGIGLEIIGPYEKIIDYEGHEIEGIHLLEDIRKFTTEFALKQILQEDLSGSISLLTRFYILWRWNYQEKKIPFDEARKLAQSVGIDLDLFWNKSFINKEKDLISVLGPTNRNLKSIENSEELIDILHTILLKWEKGENSKLLEKLNQLSGGNEILFRVAQAISQSLPNKSKEKKLIDGFLSGKERIKDAIKELKSQEKIDRWTK